MGPCTKAVFGGAKGEETRVLRERGAPLGGDSSRSRREESLLAIGVTLGCNFGRSVYVPAP